MTRPFFSRPCFTATLIVAACTLAAPPAHAAKASRKRHAPAVVQGQASYAGNEDAMSLADDIAQRRDMDPVWTRRAIAQARYVPAVVRLMQPAPAGKAKNWNAYRGRFINAARIRAGVAFWQANVQWLEKAELEYGVPPEIILGILGVETIYGQQMGNFRVLDALATLAFDFPASHPHAQQRREYFRGELEQFLRLSWHSGEDPTQALGSHAGAVGMPQFMPTSRARFAVDFDGDGRVDLAHSAADTIGSVANYLKSYGWTPGMPTHYAVHFDPQRLDKDALLRPDILPTFSVASLQARGAELEGAAPAHAGPLALVELENGDEPPLYIAGTENFYVITRYNWSSYYAMAVIELGQAIKAALER